MQIDKLVINGTIRRYLEFREILMVFYLLLGLTLSRIFSLFHTPARVSSLPVLTIRRRLHSLPCAPYKSCRTPAGTNVRLFAGITWPRHEG